MVMEVRSGKNSLTRLIAGIILIIAALLVLFHSRWWGILVGVLGLTQILSATLGFCLMEKILHHIFGFPVKGQD